MFSSRRTVNETPTNISDKVGTEKIREYTANRPGASSVPKLHIWRKLFVRGMSAFFRAWRISGKRIVPGMVIPENAVVPNQDFRDRKNRLGITAFFRTQSSWSAESDALVNLEQGRLFILPVGRQAVANMAAPGFMP